MPLPVSLKSVIDALDMSSDEFTPYINHKTGELIIVSDSDLYRAESEEEEEEEDDSDWKAPEWTEDMMADAKRVAGSDDFIPLPGRFEIHEWEIMARFCGTVTDERTRNALDRAIHGRKAFHRFKDTAHRTGVMDDWYRYRDQAMHEIAARFLNEHNIPFDPNKPAFEDPTEEG